MTAQRGPGLLNRLEALNHKVDVVTTVALGAAALYGTLEKTSLGQKAKGYITDRFLNRQVSDSQTYTFLSNKLQLAPEDQDEARTYGDDLRTLKDRVLDSRIGQGVVRFTQEIFANDSEEASNRDLVLEAFRNYPHDETSLRYDWRPAAKPTEAELEVLLDKAESSDTDIDHVLIEGYVKSTGKNDHTAKLDKYFYPTSAASLLRDYGRLNAKDDFTQVFESADLYDETGKLVNRKFIEALCERDDQVIEKGTRIGNKDQVITTYTVWEMASTADSLVGVARRTTVDAVGRKVLENKNPDKPTQAYVKQDLRFFAGLEVPSVPPFTKLAEKQ